MQKDPQLPANTQGQGNRRVTHPSFFLCSLILRLLVTCLPVERLPKEYSEYRINVYALALRLNPRTCNRELVVSETTLARILALPLASGISKSAQSADHLLRPDTSSLCSDPALTLSLVDKADCTHLLLPPLWRLVAEYACSLEGDFALPFRCSCSAIADRTRAYRQCVLSGRRH
jgi:hypothetical protein